MLAKRYMYDGKPLIKLTLLQQKIKGQVESKISNGYYKLETVSCTICGGNDFEPLSEKDRFGLKASVVICKNCGLIQTNPRMDENSLMEFYREEYSKFDLSESTPSTNYFLDRYYYGKNIYSFLKNHFTKKPSEMVVLEIGCGSGGILAYFRDHGCQAIGFDLDEVYVKFGKENYNLDLRVGTTSELKYEKKIDLVIICHVLEHFSKPSRELSLIKNLIDKNGLLYIEVPGINYLSVINQYEGDFLNYLRNMHLYHFSLATLKNLLEKNGYEMIEGNERVNSVFKQGEYKKIYQSDYKQALENLRRKEILRKIFIITPFKIRLVMTNLFYWLIRKFGMYNILRPIYRKIIGRTEPKKYE